MTVEMPAGSPVKVDDRLDVEGQIFHVMETNTGESEAPDMMAIVQRVT